MRRYATIYYLLFVLLIMGAFASMAQNAYGLKICGIACLGFALTFVHEIFFTTSTLEEQVVTPWILYAELMFLSAISLVFLFRNFSIDFLFAEKLLIVSLTSLLLLYSYQAILQLKLAKEYQAKLVYHVALYYGAVLFFILSFLASVIFPGLAINLAVVAIVLIVTFAFLSMVFKDFTIDEETMSIWQYARQMGNKSAILLIASLLISGYSLLNSAGVLPSFYYGTPKGYQNLVRVSNAGNDPEGKEKPREFKERYEEFIKKHGTN
jgi:hypothetical protein